MPDFRLLIDPADKAVRCLALEFGLRDAEHRGELATLFDGRGRTIRYLRPGGVSLDRFAELLFDRGITGARLDTHDTYALLELAFTNVPKRAVAKQRLPKRAIMRDIEEQAARAKRNRNRKSICTECGAICYSSASVTPEHHGMPMQRVDLTFNEVMMQTAECVPF